MSMLASAIALTVYIQAGPKKYNNTISIFHTIKGPGNLPPGGFCKISPSCQQNMTVVCVP